MPYIEQKARAYYDTALAEVPAALTPGDLNYCISRLVLKYIEEHGPKVKYHIINDIMGALAGVQLEFYRRVAAPYEDKKMKENGDL